MTSWAEQVFGEELQTKDGLKSTSEVLSGKKNVGIYFSAHWVSGNMNTFRENPHSNTFLQWF